MRFAWPFLQKYRSFRCGKNSGCLNGKEEEEHDYSAGLLETQQAL